ncbi:hypothetical protein ACHAQH_005160 [Verticillium albo-atrum]
MLEAYRRLTEVISSQPDDKETEEHVHQLLTSLPSVFFTTDAQKRTPLHHAASVGKPNILRAILTAGPESEVDLQDAEGCTALHLAARNGHEAVAHALLNIGADVRREEAFGETPLHEAARNGHAALVKLFIDTGAVVDVGNRDSSTALHVAARRGHFAVVEVLLAAGANPATKDKVGDTPLHDAAREGRTEIVEALLNTGLVSVEARNANGLTPLSVGARHGRDGIVRSLLERGADVDAQSSEFCTPLHQAATEGHDGVARSLIAAGAEVDLQDKDLQSALHAAVIFEHADVAGSLLCAGATVNLRDTEDCTPLHHAVKNGNRGIVRELLEAGSDPTILSAGGETALSLARVMGKESVIELFASPQLVPRQDVEANSRPKRARGPSRPNEDGEIMACKHFMGTFWCPTSETAFDDLSVWNILYEPDTEDKLCPRQPPAPPSPPPSPPPAPPRERSGIRHHDHHHHQKQQNRSKTSHVRRPDDPIKRWIHLPANNVAWVLDLVQKISAMDGRTEADCARAMRFVRDTYLEMRYSAPYRKPHFRRASAASSTSASPSLQPTEMFSLVLPVVDVEMDEQTRERLRSAMAGSRDLAPKRELLRASTAERARRLSAMPTGLQHHLFPYLKHLDAMDGLRQSFTKSELHVPRTLDQSYHESLSREEVRARNESQVLYRYLQRLEQLIKAEKQRSEGVVAGEQKSGQGSGNPFEHRELLEQHSDKQKRTDGTKEQLMKMAGRQDVASSVRARVARERKGIEQEQRKQVLMVSQLWMWRIDEHNIITCYPERWDDKNAKTLLNEIKHRVLASPDLKSSDTDMMDIAAHILESAVGFSEEEFHFQFSGPRSYCNVFAGSVAFLSNEAMKRYAAFKSSIRGMRTSKTVLGDLRAEIELLQEIDDVREEVNMIQTVLKEQERVVVEFQGSREPDCTVLEQVRGGLGGFSHPTLDFFDRLGLDADRVRTSITTLLDLRQREANIEEALSANEQSKILFIFTGATVVFAPLSWIMGVFEVNIDGLPSPITPGTVVLASIGSLLATVLVIWLSLQIYELIAGGQSSAKRRKIDAMLRRKKQDKETRGIDATVQSQPGDESAGPASQTARSSALRSEAAASAAGVGGSGQRKLRKRFVRFGRNGRKRLDEEKAVVV